VAATTRIEEMLHALAQSGQVVEGDVELVLTQPGMELRAKVRMRPKESVFVKLVKVLRLPDFHYHGS
jgi:hypothetical protein